MAWKTHASETGDCGILNRKPKVEILHAKHDEMELETKHDDEKPTYDISDDDDEIQILS